MTKRRVLVISSYTPSLVIFRFELLKKLVEQGCDVYAIGPEYDEKIIEKLRSIGAAFVHVPMDRTGLGFIADLKSVMAFWRKFRELKPDFVLPYTMKPIIYGGIAARLAGVPARCFLVTGLGQVFSDDSTWKMSAVRRLSIFLYKRAFVGAKVVFVYNDADDEDIRRNNLIDDKSRIVMVPGSGVDLELFNRSDVPSGPPVFILIARLLRTKGIFEYVEAARIVRKRHPEAKFRLLGHFDPSTTAITPEQIDSWVNEGIIEFLGQTDDVRPFLAESTAFVLPSYYREGIPRSILEAMATGRAIITADFPGCRDTVVDGVNGFLVPGRDHEKLAAAMAAIAKDPQLARDMGQRSHEMAREKFDVHAVNRLLLRQMGLL